jgi:hypothetical protein
LDNWQMLKQNQPYSNDNHFMLQLRNFEIQSKGVLY